MITTAGMKNLSDDFNFKEKEKAQQVGTELCQAQLKLVVDLFTLF